MPRRKASKEHEARYVEAGLVVLLAGTRMPRETAKHVIACNDYLRLGSERSYSHLIKLYKAQRRAFNRKEVDYAPPTCAEGTLKSWAKKFNWTERLNIYLASLEDDKKERRSKITDLWLAKPQDRIEELTFMYNVLKKPIVRFHEQQVALEQREAQEGDEEGTITFMNNSGELVTRRIIQLPILQIKEARAVLNDVAMEMGDRRGYIPKEDGVKVHVTAEDLQHAVSGMESYEEHLKSAWDISNPEFMGDIAELRVPEDLEQQ